MSNRTLVELNHDYCPSNDDVELLDWAVAMKDYMRSGDTRYLPRGVTFKHMRHHTEQYPLRETLTGRAQRLNEEARKLNDNDC